MAAALSRGDVAKAHLWRQLGCVCEGAAVAGYRWLWCRQFSFFLVIASEAKQSRLFPWRQLDCFVASLLAMTENAEPAPSPRLRHRLLHGRHELAERERLGQEVELLALAQALLECVFRVAGDEDELDVGVLLAYRFEQCRSICLRHGSVGYDERHSAT